MPITLEHPDFYSFLQFKWIFQDEEEEEEEEEKEGEEEEEKEGEEEEEEEEITRSLIQKEHVAIIVPYRNPISSITVFIKSTLSSIFTLIIISVIYIIYIVIIIHPLILIERSLFCDKHKLLAREICLHWQLSVKVNGCMLCSRED